ncbi:hypothetical protein FOCC_FOCC012472 [Frankliniella occidentalis]|nr:hypothetical protein FOCC_FOCC012472 [Frankliniella occidentalis]
MENILHSLSASLAPATVCLRLDSDAALSQAASELSARARRLVLLSCLRVSHAVAGKHHRCRPLRTARRCRRRPCRSLTLWDYRSAVPPTSQVCCDEPLPGLCSAYGCGQQTAQLPRPSRPQPPGLHPGRAKQCVTTRSPRLRRGGPLPCLRGRLQFQASSSSNPVTMHQPTSVN